MKRWLETRLSILPILEAVESSQPPNHVSLREAPPFSLGRISAILLVLLVFSGFALLLYYEPTAEGAASSLSRLHLERPLGWLVHNTHRWSALLLLGAVVLHALRVVLARAFRAPRDLNWWLGLVLLLLVILMGATGYLLRWDIKAFTLMDLLITNLSSIPIVGKTMVQAMLGGAELDQIPLYRGYAFHVWVLPLVLLFGILVHFTVAWRQGLAEQPTWWQRRKARLSNLKLVNWLPGIVLLALVLFLAWVTPHEGSAGPVDKSLAPHPDWILGFYFPILVLQPIDSGDRNVNPAWSAARLPDPHTPHREPRYEAVGPHSTLRARDPRRRLALRPDVLHGVPSSLSRLHRMPSGRYPRGSSGCSIGFRDPRSGLAGLSSPRTGDLDPYAIRATSSSALAAKRGPLAPRFPCEHPSGSRSIPPPP